MTPKIIRRAEALAFKDAASIVAEARAQAQALRDDAARVHQEQKQLGHARGVEQARREQAQAMLAVVQASAAYLDSLPARLAEVLRQALRALTHEFSDDQRLVCVVTRCVEQARDQQQLCFDVNAGQADDISRTLATLRTACPGLAHAQIRSLPHIPHGTCVLSTEVGRVECSFEGMVSAIENALVAALQEPAEQLAPVLAIEAQATVPAG